MSCEVLQVVAGEVDGVVGQIVVPTLDSQVEHEGRAGELLAGDLAVAPAAAEMVGHEPGHGTSEVGVDHQRIGLVNTGSRPHAHGAAALEENLLDLVIERDLAPRSSAARAITWRPPRSRPADGRPRTHIQETKGSRTGSGS